MLEFAAKAAGIVVIRSRLDDPLARDMLVANGRRNPHHETGPWNPITDDGDALRLVVKLGINVEHAETLGRQLYGVNCWPVGRGDCGYMETDLSDPDAATRRAIVRAAAEIGRQMP
jgi:hypothetical protein